MSPPRRPLLLLTLALAVAACPEDEPQRVDAPGPPSPDAAAEVAPNVAPHLTPDAAPPEAAPDVAPAEAAPDDGALAAARTTYTLDLTTVREPLAGAPGAETVGVPIFSHNAHAVFSIDLATTTKRVERLSWETVIELQGKGTCAGFPKDRSYVPDAERGTDAIRPYDPDNALKGFRSPYRVRLRGLELEMPYRVSQDQHVRVAGALCVAVRTGDGAWQWRARRFEPVQDPGAERATADVDLEVDDVDAVAILFESTTPVARIRFTIERAGDPSPTPGRGDLATAACCSVCAPDGPDLASRYCCSTTKPAPEPCTEERSEINPQCRPPRELYDQAAAACRAKSLWLRDYFLLDPGQVCVAPDRLTTGVRGVSFKCCRDPHFVPQPPEGPGSPADCQLVGGLSSPCASNAAMLSRQVELCFGSGLIHRYTVFGNECPGVGSSNVTSVCCRPGAAGPPIGVCSM